MRQLFFLFIIYLCCSQAIAQSIKDTLPGDQVVTINHNGELYGSLLSPKQQKGKKLVVLILAGSGPTDRNGNSQFTKNNCLLQLADQLYQNNIASLRVDKRGVGASIAAGKAEVDLRFEDYIDDAKAWTEWLKKKGFQQIVIAGHSEGALVGLMAAQSGVDGYISVAGAGRDIGTIISEQIGAQSTSLQNTTNLILDSLKAGYQVEKIPPALMSVFRPSVQPYMRSWLQYHPASIIQTLTCPILIVQGTTDLQVTVKDAELLHKAKPEAKYVLVEGMNHVLKLAPIDRVKNLATYQQPNLPLAPDLMSSIMAFLTTILSQK